MDLRSIVWVQLAFSVACWTTLAATFARTLRGSLPGIVAFAIVLLLGSSSDVAGWDGVIMSESISLSLMALLVASWLWLIDRWEWGTVAILTGVALLWAFARDSNAVVLAAAAGLTALAALGRRAPRGLVVAGLLAACWVASSASANVYHRWTVPFVNVLGQRILSSLERTAYFGGRGMPVTPALMARSGKLAWSDEWAFFRDPALKSFGVWTRHHGRSSYVAFLVAHPASTLLDPLRDLEELVSPDLGHWRPRGHAPMLGGFADWVHLGRGTLAGVLIAGALVAGAIAMTNRQHDRRWLVPLALIVWHGDPAGMDRHAVAIGVQLRLAAWMLLLVFADVGWSAFRSRRATPSRPGT